MTPEEYQNKWFASNIYQRTDFIEMLNQFKSDICKDFNEWLSDNHSSFEIPDRIVQDYIKWNI